MTWRLLWPFSRQIDRLTSFRKPKKTSSTQSLTPSLASLSNTLAWKHCQMPSRCFTLVRWYMNVLKKLQFVPHAISRSCILQTVGIKGHRRISWRPPCLCLENCCLSSFPSSSGHPLAKLAWLLQFFIAWGVCGLFWYFWRFYSRQLFLFRCLYILRVYLPGFFWHVNQAGKTVCWFC